jgi:hypothetical protein
VSEGTKRWYRVILPVEIDGRAFAYGETAELETETAVEFAHALIAVEEGEENGRNG